MLLHLPERVQIENPRDYSDLVVEELRHLLRTGAQAAPDPRRNHCFDLEEDIACYYIHISPVSGNVVLLAKWSRQSAENQASAEELFA
jgi:hypothetical protein